MAEDIIFHSPMTRNGGARTTAAREYKTLLLFSHTVCPWILGPFYLCKLPYKMGQDFLDIQYYKGPDKRKKERLKTEKERDIRKHGQTFHRSEVLD